MFDNYSTLVPHEDEGEKMTVSLGLWDTAGQEDYDKLRPLAYSNTDVFIICASVVAPDSFSNVKAKWIKEVKHHCPDTPVLLVGMKTDLRDHPETIGKLKGRNQVPFTFQGGIRLAKEIGADKYLECSSKNNQGVKEVFEEAIRVAIRADKDKNKLSSVSSGTADQDDSSTTVAPK